MRLAFQRTAIVVGLALAAAACSSTDTVTEVVPACSSAYPTGQCAAGETCAQGACVATASLCSPTNLAGSCASGLSCVYGGCVMSAAICSPTNTSGLCESGESCLDGGCVASGTLCSAANPTGACTAGQTCQAGACAAPAADPCAEQFETQQQVVAARGTAVTGASGAVTLGTLVAGNNVSVAGQGFTAVASTVTPSATQFQLGTDSSGTAANLVAAINAHVTVSTIVTAAAAGPVVNLSAKAVGVAGNYTALATNAAANVTLSGATLTGGSGTGKGLITVGGLQFRDSSGDAALDTYEDWRRSPLCRAKDLVARMTVDQKVGLMSEGGALGNGTTNGTIPGAVQTAITTGHVRQGLFRFGAPTGPQLATYINALNALSETLPLGIPVVVTCDPAHQVGFNVANNGTGSVSYPGLFSGWPSQLGLAAIGDYALTEAHGDNVRRELMAMGVRWQLGPQIDVATEPRWYRLPGTFGSNALGGANHSAAMIRGFQGNGIGDVRNGVAATMKHFAGYGAEAGGADGHTYQGRYSVFPNDNFAYHLLTFQAAIDVGVAAVMPSYTIAKNQYDINPLQVPSGFSWELMTRTAKQEMGFSGMVTGDWCTLGACGFFFGGVGYGMEMLTDAEKAALWLSAGSHQLGNESQLFFRTAYDQGLASEAMIDEAAVKILEMTFKLGLFDNPYVDDSAAAVGAAVRTQADRRLGFDAQKRSIVLLRNADHANAQRRYLPINGTRFSDVAGGTPGVPDPGEYHLDTNGDGTVNVYYDGAVDTIDGSAVVDQVDDIFGPYNYTSAAGTNRLAIAATTDLAVADVAIVRIVPRGTSMTSGIPLSFDGLLTPEELGFTTDGTLTNATTNKAKVINLLRARDGYTNAAGTLVPATNANLKIVLVMHMSRPGIVRPFINGLVSLDETLGVPGSYPSVSNEANIRQAGGGGVDAFLVEFGAMDRAVLDFLFNANVPAGVTYGAAKLPMQIPATDAQVAAQASDLPDDIQYPTYELGRNTLMPAN